MYALDAPLDAFDVLARPVEVVFDVGREEGGDGPAFGGELESAGGGFER